MKKLILLLASVLIGMVSMAQSVSALKNTVNVYFKMNDKTETYWDRAKPAQDTINQADTLWSYTFGVDHLTDATKQYVKVVLDSISGTPLTTVTWQGKYFWDDASWADITSASWYGTTSDTTLLLDQSTAKHYRFYRLLHDGNGTGTFKYSIREQQVQVYK